MDSGARLFEAPRNDVSYFGRHCAAVCVVSSRARPEPNSFSPQRAFAVRFLVAPAPGQFRHQHLGDVLEIAGRNRKRHVQPVDIGLIEPGLDGVGGFFRRADHHRPDAADADVLRDFAHGPDPIRIGAGDVVHCRAARIVFNVAHLLIEIVSGEVDAGPARHQRQRALGADMAAVVFIFGFGLGVGLAEDHGEHREHQNLGRVASCFRSEFANARDPRRDDFRRRPRHEDAFGVLGRELASARRGAGLIEYGRALRRGLAEMDGVEAEILALVPDAMHFPGIGKDAARAVAQRRVVFPNCLPRACRRLPCIRRRCRSGRHVRSACPCRRPSPRYRDSR